MASGGFPVDLAQAVALAKFAQLMKFLPLAPSLALADTQLAEPVVHRQQLTVVEPGEVRVDAGVVDCVQQTRSEEHTSELQSLMRNSYAVFCLKKKKKKNI